MFRLDGKIALITGASQGIGSAIASSFSAQGARVVLAARGVEKLEALAAEIRESGGEAHPLRLDISEAAEVAGQIEQLPAEWADVDILVNNAGITRDSLMARMTLERWNQVLNTNLTGSYAVTREFVRPMMRKRWGSDPVRVFGGRFDGQYRAG